MKKILTFCTLLCLAAACKKEAGSDFENRIVVADSIASCDMDQAQGLCKELLACAVTDKEKQQSEMLRLHLKMRQHQPIDDEEHVQDLAEFFSKHGSREEKLVANYLLASYFLDQGRNETAYQLFREIVSEGNAVNTFRSRSVMRGVYSALQYICLMDTNPTDALKWGREALESHVYDNEDQYRIYSDLGNAYYNLGQEDSCRLCMEKSMSLLANASMWDDNRLACAIDMLGYSVMAKDRKWADTCYNILTTHKFHGINSGLDFNLALYWHFVGNIDSARVHYRKAVYESNTQIGYSACRQLAHSYLSSDEKDSAIHFQELALDKIEEIFTMQDQAATKRINGLYQREEQDKVIMQQKERLLKQLLWLAVSVIAAMGGWLLVVWMRRRLRAERKARQELVRRHMALENELNRVMAELKARRALAETDVPEDENVAQVIGRLQFKCQEGNHGSTEDLALLLDYFVTQNPKFMDRLYEHCPRIKRIGILMCILALYGFRGNQIGLALGYDRQEIYHHIQRIMYALTGRRDGKAESLRTTLKEMMN